jgi:type III secretion control protein HpaP
MTIHRAYAIHAIEEDAGDAPASPAQARRRFDYAALIRRARLGARETQARMNPTLGADEAHSSADGSRSGGEPTSTTDAAHADRFALAQQGGARKRASLTDHPHTDLVEPPTLSAAESLEQRLQRLDAPYLDVLARDQQTAFLLLDYLTARVADFCTDPAVLAQGHWTMRLTLDPAILPDCTLALTLSYFDLTLRFDSRDPASRQLVLHHADVLKQRLEALLEQYDAPRTVEILAD